MNTELIEAISSLKKDSREEIIETTETTDFELLKLRKKVLALLQQKEDASVLRQKKLDEREVAEIEEKRKRAEEDDAYDYLGAYGTSNRNGGIKA